MQSLQYIFRDASEKGEKEKGKEEEKARKDPFYGWYENITLLAHSHTHTHTVFSYDLPFESFKAIFLSRFASFSFFICHWKPRKHVQRKEEKAFSSKIHTHTCMYIGISPSLPLEWVYQDSFPDARGIYKSVSESSKIDSILFWFSWIVKWKLKNQ